jgi:hypothetical protein
MKVKDTAGLALRLFMCARHEEQLGGESPLRAS